MVRYRNKTYIQIPGGEIQYAHTTGRICMWFRGRLYTLRKAKRAA